MKCNGIAINLSLSDSIIVCPIRSIIRIVLIVSYYPLYYRSTSPITMISKMEKTRSFRYINHIKFLFMKTKDTLFNMYYKTYKSTFYKRKEYLITAGDD